jgi:hypothetical protein
MSATSVDDTLMFRKQKLRAKEKVPIEWNEISLDLEAY